MLCVLFFCVFSVRKRMHPLYEMTHQQIGGDVFSHRTHRFNRIFLRTVPIPQDSGPSPNPSPAGRGVVCEVTPIRLLTQFLGSSFSHRTHRFNRTFWRTVSSPQKASGIQSSQSITAKEGCWVIVVRC